jgi:hypothetical protein
MRIKLHLAALSGFYLFFCLIAAPAVMATINQAQASLASPPTKAEVKPDAGSVLDNVYRNQFFGFRYTFPKGWMVSQDERKSREGQPPAEPSVHMLLFAFQHHNLPEISTIMVRAVELSSPDVTARQFLLDEYPAEKARGANSQGDPKELSFAGWRFFSAVFKAKVGGGIISEEKIVTIQRGYALEFYFVTNQDKTFKALHKTVESLTLGTSSE